MKEATIRPLVEADLPEADRILRLAFGTFFGLPDPMAAFGDADYVYTRWRTNPDAALGIEKNGELVGSNFVASWGSVGFFGPLSIRPDLWNLGLAKHLIESTMGVFRKWGVRHRGLFTFAHSTKHIRLYQQFDFWPRFLTLLLAKPITSVPAQTQVGYSRFSSIPSGDRAACLDACRDVSDTVYRGLALDREIAAVADQKLGETLLLWKGGKLDGFAVCHAGAKTEAGTGTLYVKFAAARSGGDAKDHFLRLLRACEEEAALRGLTRVIAGVNAGRHEAYRSLVTLGFRAEEPQGVTMHHENDAGYSCADVYVIDDWR